MSRLSHSSHSTCSGLSSCLADAAAVCAGILIANPSASGSEASPQCSHPMHAATMESACATPREQQLNTEHYRRQLQKFRDQAAASGGETARINGHLNDIFVKRLHDIDCNAEGDVDLKLLTYQEWVDMLLHINDSIITNMDCLESEVAERLDVLTRRAAASNCGSAGGGSGGVSPCRPSQAAELAKCRRDIATLLRVIQQGYHCDNWSLQGLHFETLLPSQILGQVTPVMPTAKCVPQLDDPCNPCAPQQSPRHKPWSDRPQLTNMKALAQEVAEKHDEIRELKKQILLYMEDEVQAQRKIQLKDDVIRELRNDLKLAHAKENNHVLELGCSSAMVPPIPQMPLPMHRLSQSTRSACTQVSGAQTPCSHFESLSQTEQLEQEKLKLLEDELNQLFALTKDWKKQNMEYHRKRLSDIFQRSEAEKAEACRKLNFLRQQLIDLEATGAHSSWNDCDSGFSSKSENNQDVKLLESLRRRLRKLNECTFDLTKRVQKLEIENNALCSNLEAEKTFAQCNCETLKELADMMCDMTGEQFSYQDMYNTPNTAGNPFCDSVRQLHHDHCRKERELLGAVRAREKRIEELEVKIEEIASRFSKGRGGPSRRADNNSTVSGNDKNSNTFHTSTGTTTKTTTNITPATKAIAASTPTAKATTTTTPTTTTPLHVSQLASSAASVQQGTQATQQRPTTTTTRAHTPTAQGRSATATNSATRQTAQQKTQQQQLQKQHQQQRTHHSNAPDDCKADGDAWNW